MKFGPAKEDPVNTILETFYATFTLHNVGEVFER